MINPLSLVISGSSPSVSSGGVVDGGLGGHRVGDGGLGGHRVGDGAAGGGGLPIGGLGGGGVGGFGVGGGVDLEFGCSIIERRQKLSSLPSSCVKNPFSFASYLRWKNYWSWMIPDKRRLKPWLPPWNFLWSWNRIS